jgi:hypothetical protein
MRSVQIAVAGALIAGLVVGGPVPSQAVQAAYPVGTVTLSERNEPSTIMVRGASEGGLLYETDSAVHGASQWWLKARQLDEARSLAVRLLPPIPRRTGRRQGLPDRLQWLIERPVQLRRCCQFQRQGGRL